MIFNKSRLGIVPNVFDSSRIAIDVEAENIVKAFFELFFWLNHLYFFSLALRFFGGYTFNN